MKNEKIYLYLICATEPVTFPWGRIIETLKMWVIIFCSFQMSEFY